MTIEVIQQLEELFHQQIDAVTRLTEILQQENKVLKDRQFDAIQALTDDKTRQGLFLEELCVKQSKLIESAGYTYSKEGLDDFFKTLPKDVAARLCQIRDQLHILLEESKRLNMINGNIIAANRQTAETALAILRGNFNTDNELIYGATGQPINETSNKPITRA